MMCQQTLQGYTVYESTKDAPLVYTGDEFPPTVKYETKECYSLRIQLCGFQTNELEIDAPNSRTITIKGFSKSQTPGVQSFNRIYMFPEDACTENVSAPLIFDDVLWISVPKNGV